MITDDDELLIKLLIEQMALKIQMSELNAASLKEKLGVTHHRVYAVKTANLGRIMQEGRALARARRRGMDTA